MCYNAITGSAPSYFSELLHLYSPSRSLCSSSDTRMLKIHGFRTFSHFGPHIWNNLPQEPLCYSLFLQNPTQDISLLRIFQLSHICPSLLSVCTVCVCVCVCISGIMFKTLVNIKNKKWITFSISMCVSLFSILSCRVDAFQISIIIIIRRWRELLWRWWLLTTLSAVCVANSQVNEYHSTVARCLQMMVRVDSYRTVFVDVDGISV